MNGLSQHLDTIYSALYEWRQGLRERNTIYIVNDYEQAIDRIDAALDYLDTLPTPGAAQPVALDFPDSPGWWAFEGSYRWRDEIKCAYNVTNWKDDHEVIKGDYCAAIQLDGGLPWFPSRYATGRRQWEGKWYRLHMPWDSTAPQPAAPASE